MLYPRSILLLGLMFYTCQVVGQVNSFEYLGDKINVADIKNWKDHQLIIRCGKKKTYDFSRDALYQYEEKQNNFINPIPVIFLYTAFVFWGLKLDLKELEIKKPLFMSILIVQYVIGLICLAYIANYIISK